MSGRWIIGQRVRYEDTEDPRPLPEQMRGKVVGLVWFQDDSGMHLDGVHVHWDGDRARYVDSISVNDGSFTGLKSNEDTV